MSKIYNLTMEIRVFDEQALMKVATAHAQRFKDQPAIRVDTVEDALIMLLDPADGTDAYQGNLDGAGMEIIQSAVEEIPFSRTLPQGLSAAE